ncbi:MAG TPA: hypothetical protein VM123_20035 [archaeon]|nr:hypothetical protein [archaeon]
MENKIIFKLTTLLTLFSFLTLTVGCGAIFKGTSQNVKIMSSPASTVTVDPGGMQQSTPTTLDLDRGKSYVLTFSKEGYESQKVEIKKKVSVGIIVLDVLLAGLIGVVIDAVTGSWYNLKPDQVSITLVKSSTGALDLPDEIIITIQAIGDGSISITSSAPGVSVSTLEIETEHSLTK